MSEFACLDANVAAKLVLPEDDSSQAEQLYAGLNELGFTFIAPPHLRIEVLNAIWKYVVRREITAVGARNTWERFQELPIEVVEPIGLYHRALGLAEQYRRPTVYDAHYIALAEIYRCDFWTADQRLLNALDGRLPFVRALGQYLAETDDAGAP